jgi:hypothetical protein
MIKLLWITLKFLLFLLVGALLAINTIPYSFFTWIRYHLRRILYYLMPKGEITKVGKTI